MTATSTTWTCNHVADTRAAPQIRKPTQRNASGTCCEGAKTNIVTASVAATCSAVSPRPAGAGRRGAIRTTGAMQRTADRCDGTTARNAAHGFWSSQTHTTTDATTAVARAPTDAAKPKRA